MAASDSHEDGAGLQKKAAGAKDAFRLTLKALATFTVRVLRVKALVCAAGARCAVSPVSPWCGCAPARFRGQHCAGGARQSWLACKDVRAARAPEHARRAAQDEEQAAVAEVKGVAADAVADYLRSADVYQVHTRVTAHFGARLCA